MSFKYSSNNLQAQNAGLVLLWPFLGNYFTRLNLLKEGKFLTKDDAYRAVHMLQFIAYGNQSTSEYEMKLNKVLCNVALQDSISRSSHFTDQEIELSIDLIKAVTQNWEELKNTSIDGFRVSFLQREGTMSKTSDGWKLSVDHRAQDALLETLPWSLSRVKTSWMNEFLYVEWTT
jgi:hypothetical protein